MTDVQEKASPITAEQMSKFRELQKKIKEFEKSLKPRKESVFDSVVENVDMDEVKQLIEFSGKDSLTVSGEFGDNEEKLTVSFRFGKTAEEE